MFGDKFVTQAIHRSAENGLDRRTFFGAAGLGVAGAADGPAEPREAHGSGIRAHPDGPVTHRVA